MLANSLSSSSARLARRLTAAAQAGSVLAAELVEGQRETAHILANSSVSSALVQHRGMEAWARANSAFWISNLSVLKAPPKKHPSKVIPKVEVLPHPQPPPPHPTVGRRRKTTVPGS